MDGTTLWEARARALLTREVTKWQRATGARVTPQQVALLVDRLLPFVAALPELERKEA